MYDIFYVSRFAIRNSDWNFFKKKYPLAIKIENVQHFEQIKSKAFTKMFWVVWNDTEILDSFNLLEYTVSPWDEQYIHCFINEETGYANGLVLFSKNINVTDKEFKDRYYLNKKEIEIVATRDKQKIYDKFVIDTYEDYILANKSSSTEMFWAQWKELEIVDNTVFNLYFDPRDGRNEYDINENHIFKNKFKNSSSYKNGIVLFSTNKVVSKKEIDHRFLIEKKEHNIVVSRFKPYDIIFISYNEPNSDSNYENLKKRFPNAKRVHGVKGIHQAHIEAAKLSTTDNFWVVDGDAEIVDTFNFDHELETWEKNSVHVWRSRNPINDLEYGYGGVKLLPRQLTIEMDTSTADMTTSISKNFVVMDIVSNFTMFNTDPFSTWRSAFRECCKLSSKIIQGQDNEETNNRLEIWKTLGKDKPFGNYSISGALAGTEYGEKNKQDKEALNKINDFSWLREYFEKEFNTIPRS